MKAWWAEFADQWWRIGWAHYCERRYAQVARDEQLTSQWAGC